MGRRTAQKRSTVSKKELRKEYLESSPLYDTCTSTFEKTGICPTKFKTFVSTTLPRWLAYELLPDVVELSFVD